MAKLSRRGAILAVLLATQAEARGRNGLAADQAEGIPADEPNVWQQITLPDDKEDYDAPEVPSGTDDGVTVRTQVQRVPATWYLIVRFKDQEAKITMQEIMDALKGY